MIIIQLLHPFIPVRKEIKYTLLDDIKSVGNKKERRCDEGKNN